MREYKNNR